MSTRTGSLRVPQHVRDAAIEDYLNSGDTLTAVADRHNVSRSALSHWTTSGTGIAYEGGWNIRGGVNYPTAPEKRTA